MDQDAWRARVEDEDISVFEIKSQTTKRDKKTLLIVQNFLREQIGAYSYLEIGSHLGGSLVPHLAHPECTRIASVDPRPVQFRDERGRLENYKGNSTERMVSGLSAILPEPCMGKLETYDCDAGQLKDHGLTKGFDLALIDGEHTNTAAFRDYLNVRKYMAKSSIILFHDSNIVFDALRNVQTLLDDEGTLYSGYYLPGILYALVLGKYRKPAEKVLGPRAHDPEEYLQKARAKLQEKISWHVKAA